MPGMTHSTSIVDPNGATSLVFWEVLNVPARSYEIVVKTSNNNQNPGAKTRLPTPCFWLNMKVCRKMQCSTSCQNARYHQLEVTRPIHASQNCQDPCRCSSSPCARSLKACKKGCKHWHLRNTCHSWHDLECLSLVLLFASNLHGFAVLVLVNKGPCP